MTINSWGSDDPMEVAKGGLGASSHTDGSVLFGSGTSPVTNSGLLAKGSILVGDGTTDPSVLAVGTDAQILYADSAESSGVKFATVNNSDKRTLLETITIASDASVTTSATIDTTYNNYELDLIDILPATNAVFLKCQFVEDGGSLLTSSLYKTRVFGQSMSNLSAGFSEDLKDHMRLSGKGNTTDFTLSNVASEAFSAILVLQNPNSTDVVPSIIQTAADYYSSQATPKYVTHNAFSYYDSAVGINALKFFMSSGNMTSGTIKVYGIW